MGLCQWNGDIAVKLRPLVAEPRHAAVGLRGGGDGGQPDAGALAVGGEVSSARLLHHAVEGVDGDYVELCGFLRQDRQLDALLLGLPAGGHGVFKDVADHAAQVHVGHGKRIRQPHLDRKVDVIL